MQALPAKIDVARPMLGDGGEEGAPVLPTGTERYIHSIVCYSENTLKSLLAGRKRWSWAV